MGLMLELVTFKVGDGAVPKIVCPATLTVLTELLLDVQSLSLRAASADIVGG